MTIEEDLKTLIDGQWSLVASPAITVYVYIKNDPADKEMTPAVPVADSVFAVIIPTPATPIRYSRNTFLYVYEGKVIIYAATYANMTATLDELKDIFGDNTDGDLTYFDPAIEGDVGEKVYLCNMLYKWEKLTEK